MASSILSKFVKDDRGYAFNLVFSMVLNHEFAHAMMGVDKNEI